MQITPLDIHDPAQADELFALEQATHAADRPDNPPPLYDALITRLRQDDLEVRVALMSARLDDRMVGYALIALPTIDNRHLAQVEVRVDPRHRRRGVGSALLETMIERAGAEQRSVLIGGVTGPVPGGPPRGEAGARFAEAHGLTPALPNTQRRADLQATDVAAEQRLLDECLFHAADYDIVTWHGITPDRLADGVASLVNRLVVDAPIGEIDIQETTLDTERLHAEDHNALARGTHLVGAAAVHRPTGEVAAVTRIDVRPPGDHGGIWLTIAHPKHRGHRLGTLVKIEVHRRVRREFPQLRYVNTGNADANAHMVAINDRLGYVPYETATAYQRRLD
jgi:GNAT superfamily N-acetyltransferase